MVTVTPLIIAPGASRAEFQAIAPPGRGGPSGQMFAPPDADGVTALVIASFFAGRSVALVIADTVWYLIERTALHADWKTVVPSYREDLI